MTAADADGTVVRDASTGEELAVVSTAGIDTAAAVRFARTSGQAELGRFTFHERALKLKELAQYLNAHCEPLYELSAKTGATKLDSMA